jgi:hypothetical protein
MMRSDLENPRTAAVLWKKPSSLWSRRRVLLFSQRRFDVASTSSALSVSTVPAPSPPGPCIRHGEDFDLNQAEKIERKRTKKAMRRRRSRKEESTDPLQDDLF